MSDTQRNFLIVGAIALVLVLTQLQGTVTSLNRLVSIAFVICIGIVLWQWHRNNAMRISAMKAADRLLLQSSGIVLFVVMVTGTIIPAWSLYSSMYTVLFFAMIAACIMGMYTAWQRRPY